MLADSYAIERTLRLNSGDGVLEGVFVTGGNIFLFGDLGGCKKYAPSFGLANQVFGVGFLV